MQMLDFERLERRVPELRTEFAQAKPFPHVVIDDFLPEGSAERALGDFEPGDGWNHYRHYNENKLAITDFAALSEPTHELVAELHSARFLDFLAAVSGIDGLAGDPDLEGGCLHKVLPGGSLNVHSDFLSHSEHRSWSRQLNLLLYFNRGWQPEWRGDLEFWDRDVSTCSRAITPLFNRCVIFRTSEHSFHGHPSPLACPPGEARKSMALYYFRDEGVPQRVRPTHYCALPHDPPHRRALVAMDSALLRVYAMLKRSTPLTDRMVSRVLKHL